MRNLTSRTRRILGASVATVIAVAASVAMTWPANAETITPETAPANLPVSTVADAADLPTADSADGQRLDGSAARKSTQDKIVAVARAIAAGHSEPGWRGGRVPYSWGAGHGAKAGPTLGTCDGYTGRIHPCPANHTRGVDCSGFARWVYEVAFGRDVFGAGNTNDQIRNPHLHKTSHPRPGDLVFYGTSTGNTHHVGIYVGNGRMVDALMTGTDVEVDSVHAASGLLGYWHYKA